MASRYKMHFLWSCVEDTNFLELNSELIAKSIVKVTGKNVSQLISEKENSIYAQLKNDIQHKAKSIKTNADKKTLDKLISDVDEKIQTGLKYE